MQIIFRFMVAFIILHSIALGAVDREIHESKKCSSMFSYFERKYGLPKNILHSISLQETQKPHSKHKIKVVWPWTINVEGKGFHFDTKNDALRFVQNQIRNGKESIDVGCMQINLKYHPTAFHSIDQAFSPIKNVAYAAKLLRTHYEKHGSWDKAVGYYHSSTEERASTYHASVKKINNRMVSYKRDLNRYYYNGNGEYTRHDARTTQKYAIARNKRINIPRHFSMTTINVNVGKQKRNNLFRKIH